MSRRRRLALVVLALAIAVASVAIVGPSLVKAEPAPLSWQALRNTTYPTSLGSVALKDGVFEAPAAPGSASKILVRLVDLAAFGAIDGDDYPDAAVLLIASGGGTGTFIDLVAVMNEQGTPRPVARVLLGDRVLVREVRIESGQIFVRLRTRVPADPLARLTQETSRRYALQGGALVLLDESSAEVVLPAADDFVYRPERVDVPLGEARSLQGSLAPGQIASYVVRADAGDVLDLRARSLFNNAVLSVSGLGDGTTLVSRRDYATDRSLVLAESQDYAVRVVNLAGGTLPFTLDVRRDRPQRTPAPTQRPSAEPRPSLTPRPLATSSAERPLGAVSSAALSFARSRPPIWSIAVVLPASGVVYAENADEQVPTASVVKVLVMLAVLERARAERRPVSEAELALLWPMVTESDNDATSELWDDVGRGQAVQAYLQSVGVAGFTPDPGTSWGVSFASARAMATILGKLLSGEILDEPSRALALRLLDAVIPQQRWGITAGATAGDAVGVKNGWYPGDEGWRVNSVGVVRPKAGNPYAIAIMTDARASWREGIDTIEGTAEKINGDLHRGQG